MPERAVAADREPAEQNREDVEQEDADHELRRRNPDEAQDHDRVVGRFAAFHRGEHAGGQADQQLAEYGARHQEQRRRKARQDQFGNLGFLNVGPAEIALKQAREIAQILLVERQVKA